MDNPEELSGLDRERRDNDYSDILGSAYKSAENNQIILDYLYHFWKENFVYRGEESIENENLFYYAYMGDLAKLTSEIDNLNWDFNIKVSQISILFSYLMDNDVTNAASKYVFNIYASVSRESLKLIGVLQNQVTELQNIAQNNASDIQELKDIVKGLVIQQQQSVNTYSDNNSMLTQFASISSSSINVNIDSDMSQSKTKNNSKM